MGDWMIGVICVMLLALAYGLGYGGSASIIGWECRNVGTFYVGDKIYSCELKEKATK